MTKTIISLIFSLLCLSIQAKSAYIVYLSGKGIGASSFGHTYFAVADDDIHRAKMYEFVGETGEQINILRGIGLGESYNLLLNKVPFRKERREQLLGEDRDIYFYKLALEEETISEIENELNDFKNRVSDPDYRYNFFSRNCTSVWADIFTKYFGTKNGALDNIPYLFVQRLKNYGIITEEIKIHRYSHYRKTIIKKHFFETREVTSSHVYDLSRSIMQNKRELVMFYLAAYEDDTVAKEYRKYESAKLGNYYAKNLRSNITLNLVSLGELNFDASRITYQSKGEKQFNIIIYGERSAAPRLRIKDSCEDLKCDYFIYDNQLIKAEFQRK